MPRSRCAPARHSAQSNANSSEATRSCVSRSIASSLEYCSMDGPERRAMAAETAAEWWVRLKDPRIPMSEREQFVDWLRESPVHVAEMLRVAQVHDALANFRRWT